MHPNVKFHFYANDTQFFIHLTHLSAVQAIERLKLCNKLKFNTGKTELIIFGSRMQQLNKFLPVNILGKSIMPAENMNNLEVWFDF